MVQPAPAKIARTGGEEEVVKEKPRAMDMHMQGLLVANTKATLRQMQDMRDVQGILFDTCLGDAKLEEFEAGQEQSRAYAEEAKGNKGHNLGPHHLLVAGGVVDSLREQLELKRAEDPTWGLMADQMKRLSDELDKASIEEKGKMIRYFNLSATYQKKGEAPKLRLTMSWGPDHASQPARELVCKVLRQLSGVDMKVGRAPAGHLERELQAWLEVINQ